MNDKNNRICPVEKAGSLDLRIRRWVQNPQKILKPYINEGMTILELGCGPGFFTVDMARLVGETGLVIAVDLQEGMLEKVRRKIEKTGFEKRILLHKCEENKIGISKDIDFALLFYMVHEVRDKPLLFRQVMQMLKPSGQVLIVEPPFHVSKKAFEASIKKAESEGLTLVQRPKIFLSKTAVLKNTVHENG